MDSDSIMLEVSTVTSMHPDHDSVFIAGPSISLKYKLIGDNDSIRLIGIQNSNGSVGPLSEEELVFRRL
ncbi:hypothetical protein [Fulvivirga ligni]|uniref:hypothetical protein n=1 Tax=Fulvivirga ligni TaxID=2904246 RepID=UPI001F34B48D|nr:hypothetical protein [Fulvivirga ligni]UII23363.1 hypothetical protein LVD16_09000 [Fulvivirga ligni]